MRLIRLISLFMVLCVAAQAQTQTELTQTNVGADSLKRYRVTINLISGKKVDGLLWAVTDSTLLYIANTRAERLAYRSGVQPVPDTIRATAIKRIALRRRGYFAQVVGPGVSIATVLFLLTWTNPTPTFGALFSKLMLGGVVAPLIAVGSIAQGLIPPIRKPIWGSKKRFRQAAARLDRYSISSQIQRP